MQWATTTEGCLIWVQKDEQIVSYSWDGDIISNVANGPGVLTIKRRGSEFEHCTIELEYGAPKSSFKFTSDNQLYVGKTNKGFINGFAVLITDNEVYIGNFINSHPDGLLDLYKDGILYYSGSWKSGAISGFGTLYSNNGSVLSGLWDNGKLIETSASITSTTGNYTGDLKNNEPNGYGIMSYSTGARYEGEWKDSKWDGDGTFTSNLFKYTGEWENNLPDGIGTAIFADSSFYEGSWVEGKRYGYGNNLFTSLDFYSGEWKNDLFNGEGSLLYVDGSEYHGLWKNGLQNGEGLYVSTNVIYEGEWEEGWVNGKGRAEYSNGDIYEGDFVENERYGQGVYYFSNGNVYDGEFVDDTFNGLGVFYFNDGSRYEGEFVSGRICGDGTYYYNDEDGIVSITAVWDGSNRFPSIVSMAFPNGDIFEGSIIDGIPSTDGVWIAGKKSKIDDALATASDFYSIHEETIHRVAFGVGLTLTAVSLITPVGWIATTATVVSNVIYITDMATSVAYNAYNGNMEEATNEVLLNVAFIAAPPVVKAASRKTSALLSPIAKKIGKAASSRLVTVTKTKPFKQIVKVTRKEGETFEKKLAPATRKTASRATKPHQKFESILLSSRLPKTQIQNKLNKILEKGPIKLSNKEFEWLIKNPKDIRNFILTKTGDKKNFQEFFIRLSKWNKQKTRELLEVPEIRKFVDHSIRHSNGAGGMHEWLMTSNFQDFLLNPRWGKDGPYLALSLTELTQKTELIIFKNGFGHPSAIRPNNSASANWHNNLSRVISSCSTKEELFVAIKKYAKNTLSKESYDEFRRIFWDVFSVAK